MASAQPIRKTKGKIKPPKKHGPDTSIQETWSSLSHSIREIQSERANKLSFEENYRHGYNLVLFRQGEFLYNNTKHLITQHLQNMVDEFVVPCFSSRSNNDPIGRAQEGELLMKGVRKVWDKHNSAMKKLSDILKYMDRVHVPTAGVPTITQAGLSLFTSTVLHSSKVPVQQQVVSAIQGQIQVERDGYTINQTAVKEVVDIYLQLEDATGRKLYYADLEGPVLEDTRTFYKAEAEKLLETCDAPEYLRRVETRLDSEESRAYYYLSSSTFPTIRSILESHLLASHLNTIMSMPNSGLDTMIDSITLHGENGRGQIEGKLEDINRMYRLFFQVSTNSGGSEMLRKGLKDSILTRGKIINENADPSNSGGAVGDDDTEMKGADVKGKGKARAVEDQDQEVVKSSKGKSKEVEKGGKMTSPQQTLTSALKWVEDTLELKDRFDIIQKFALVGDRSCELSITEALGTTINQNPRAAEYISLFIDENLKKGLKGKSDSEVDLVLEKTITIFRFILDKDAFERYYKSHLARRLLLNRSVSDDAERGMLAKLKVECGFQFTKKLEGMFLDMKLSTEVMDAYKEYLVNTTAPAIEIGVIVQTSTFWPSISNIPCNFPPSLLSAISSFDRFYNTRHSGRRLTFQPSLGNADVRVAFNAKKHELNVSTFALIILLLFEELEEDEFLTYDDLRNQSGIPDAELSRHLQSLACAKYKVLKKHPPGREVGKEDSFSFNDGFTSPLFKIKIGTVASRVESQEERRETLERVEEERKQQAEACIVRVMKDRKTLGHNELVNEVTRQLAHRFQPNPGMIKKRIEALIEREYLERREDRKSYNYLA